MVLTAPPGIQLSVGVCPTNSTVIRMCVRACVCVCAHMYTSVVFGVVSLASLAC